MQIPSVCAETDEFGFGLGEPGHDAPAHVEAEVGDEVFVFDAAEIVFDVTHV